MATQFVTEDTMNNNNSRAQGIRFLAIETLH